MQTVKVENHHSSGYQDLSLPLALDCYNSSTTFPGNGPEMTWTWAVQLALVLSSLWLFRYLWALWPLATSSTPLRYKDPPQVPYALPIVGNLISYLHDAGKLASTITCVVNFL